MIEVQLLSDANKPLATIVIQLGLSIICVEVYTVVIAFDLAVINVYKVEHLLFSILLREPR